MILGPWYLTLVALFLSPLVPSEPTLSDQCFQSSKTFEGLIRCLQRLIVPDDHYYQLSYMDAQPTPMQRQAWHKAVTNLLYTNNNCTSAIVPQPLTDIYAVNLFADSGGKSFCVLYERSVCRCNGLYEKGWGTVAVPLSRDTISRTLHLSAPHPIHDIGTSAQAAHLFKTTGSKSFIVPGRTRIAYRAPSTCVAPTTSQSMYYKTDPAHNDLEPFFDANSAIWEWQARYGGCPSSSCAFIQFHGKGKNTCPNDGIFLSTGLANHTWYTDNVDRPIKRLKNELIRVFNSDYFEYPIGPLTISLPSDSTCILRATKNVIGRYLNNYSPSRENVCTRSADPLLTTGMFVHIEQAAVSRSKESWKAWSIALMNTFDELNPNIWDVQQEMEKGSEEVDNTMSPSSVSTEEADNVGMGAVRFGFMDSIFGWRHRHNLLHLFLGIL